MSADLSTLPCARLDLVIRPLGENGAFVVKEPHTGSYFHLGEEEHFLLTQLHGERTFETVASAFAEKFGQPLTEADLAEFLKLARTQGLLAPGDGLPPAAAAERPAKRGASPHHLLFYRVRLVDPDRFFTRLAPSIWFFWTRGFLLVSFLCIAAAAAILWLNRYEAAQGLVDSLSWQMGLQLWLALVAVIALHECAHGLTCKHFGGAVHEIGFLLLLFMPCLYCNVSDAWLFRQKSRRLWVTFAGGYFELFLWSLAVFAWRVTSGQSLVHMVTLVITTSCGLRTLFNFNPLIKLDGYYLLSDWAEIPNLQQRSAEHLMAHVRWLLWGARRPEAEPRGGFLLTYAFLSLLFSLGMMSMMLFGAVKFAGTRWGWIVTPALLVFLGWGFRNLFRGVSAGEAFKMIQYRQKRLILGTLIPVVALGSLCCLEVEDREGGSFVLRGAAHVEVRAPLAGFLRELAVDEGEQIREGELVARLEIPDLASRISQKRAEVREAQARLQLLLAGARSEQLYEQQQKVQRAAAWRDLARDDVDHARKALQADLARLTKQIEQHTAEWEFAVLTLSLTNKLAQTRAVSTQEMLLSQKQCRVARAQIEQDRAQKQSRELLGMHEAEAELARREKELADAQASLALMKVPPRPEEVAAEQARGARLEEECRYLDTLGARLVIASPITGVISTPHLKEKRGQYVKEGDLICQIEDCSGIVAEIALPEEKEARVLPGQAVSLKVRSLPFATYMTTVNNAAPAIRADPNHPVNAGEAQGILAVYCRLPNDSGELRPGMNGYARIAISQRRAGGYFLDRLWRLVRTEFWW
jgi:putative peptide zinc metalloprotease protein